MDDEGKEKMLRLDKLVNDLHNHVIKICFKKVDGTERVMDITLMNEYLPPMKPEDENKPKKKPNPNVIVAWSVGDNGWRSIRKDSIHYWHWNTEIGEVEG